MITACSPVFEQPFVSEYSVWVFGLLACLWTTIHQQESVCLWTTIRFWVFGLWVWLGTWCRLLVPCKRLPQAEKGKKGKRGKKGKKAKKKKGKKDKRGNKKRKKEKKPNAAGYGLRRKNQVLDRKFRRCKDGTHIFWSLDFSLAFYVCKSLHSVCVCFNLILILILVFAYCLCVFSVVMLQ